MQSRMAAPRLSVAYWPNLGRGRWSFMLIWLASYPRSGNHLLRAILSRCFELGSYDIYQNIGGRSDPALAGVLGARTVDEKSSAAFIARARISSEPILVKTHDLVPGTDRCIYIVRDGRAALASYRRYLADVENRPHTLPELIEGKVWPGGWQRHVEQFLARDPAKTLVLRYEDLASADPPLAKIAAFVGAPIRRQFDIAFDDLHRLSPAMFPTGSNEPGVEIVERECSDAFWRICGPAMARLGYAKLADTPATAARMAEAGPSALADGQLPMPLGRNLLPIDGAWIVVSGFDDVEGPFPDKGITKPFHWATSQPTILRVFNARQGVRVLSLRVGSALRGQRLGLRFSGGPVMYRKVRRHSPKVGLLTFRRHFEAGPVTIELMVDQWATTPEGRTLGLMLGGVALSDPPQRLSWLKRVLPKLLRARL